MFRAVSGGHELPITGGIQAAVKLSEARLLGAQLIVGRRSG